MKTTIDLPDELLREAKAVALRRGTTLRAVMTHALEREVQAGDLSHREGIVVDGDGLPALAPRGVRVTGELVSRLLDEDAR